MAAVGALALLNQAGPGETRAVAPTLASAERPAAAVLGGPTPERRRSRPNPARRVAGEDVAGRRSSERRASGAGRAVARRFVGALLRYELGAPPRTSGRELRATATRALARFVLARQPRLSAVMRPPAAGRLTALEPLPVRVPGRAEFAATIKRGARTTGMVVGLERHGGRWWVRAVR